MATHGEQARLDSVPALVLSSPYYSLGIWASHGWRLTGQCDAWHEVEAR